MNVNARGRGTVVELLGAPGAGKSGLAAALEALDGVAVVKDHQPGDWPVLAWSMTRSLSVAVAPPPHVDRRRWASWAARIRAARHVARNRVAHGAQTVVFDQGAAYTLVRMLHLRRRRPPGDVWWVQRTIDTACLLDLLVLVDADTDTLAARLRSRRKDHHADDLDLQALHGYLESERRDCHEVADALAREGADVIRLVTTELSVEEQVTRVLEELAVADRAPALTAQLPSRTKR